MKYFFLATLGALLASCSHNVKVVDSSGRPIEDARVVASARSTTFNPVFTNSKGETFVHENMPKIEWLQVSASGYRPEMHVSYYQPKPIRVVLQRQ